MDAARIDGAGPIRFAWSILLPVSMNVIAALAVIEFAYMWNQYQRPLIVSMLLQEQFSRGFTLSQEK
ncbi:ABC transporter permease subunit [Desulfobacula sp.]|uniref:ABC transporter permease subunit n=1 Tax=Desulfobacula sp. TaxID=2593537 RepID=UPI0039B98CFE